MVDYKTKALKYKLKYLNLKKYILIGGKFDKAKITKLGLTTITKKQIEFIQEIEAHSIKAGMEN